MTCFKTSSSCCFMLVFGMAYANNNNDITLFMETSATSFDDVQKVYKNWPILFMYHQVLVFIQWECWWSFLSSNACWRWLGSDPMPIQGLIDWICIYEQCNIRVKKSALRVFDPHELFWTWSLKNVHHFQPLLVWKEEDWAMEPSITKPILQKPSFLYEMKYWSTGCTPSHCSDKGLNGWGHGVYGISCTFPHIIYGVNGCGYIVLKTEEIIIDIDTIWYYKILRVLIKYRYIDHH